MISVNWLLNQTCENCQQNKPNCAEITIALNEQVSGKTDLHNLTFCSDCVEELKRRLS